jgi:YHS domain-containing protein
MRSENGLKLDPVCGRIIEVKNAYAILEHRGKQYPVCCPLCQEAFEHDTESFVYLYELQQLKAAGQPDEELHL